MRRGLIDRLADTAPFRVLLLVAGIVVVPVLLLGALMIPVAVAANEPSGWVITLLALGGIAGFVGWLRAGWGVRNPERHNIRLTLLCLWTGIATALSLGVGILVAVAFAADDGWSVSLLPATGFAAAPLIWVLEGLAWAGRLRRSYAERTGEPVDTLPTLFLLLAVGLAITAAIVATTL